MRRPLKTHRFCSPFALFPPVKYVYISVHPWLKSFACVFAALQPLRYECFVTMEIPLCLRVRSFCLHFFAASLLLSVRSVPPEIRVHQCPSVVEVICFVFAALQPLRYECFVIMEIPPTDPRLTPRVNSTKFD